ncbi:MAG: hypothetical protein QOG01_2811 [Pseudonocardiales bacterium]|jgi:hypothetical protein|nr:hypothetical protein [Pseudonocardiales bacterium]
MHRKSRSPLTRIAVAVVSAVLAILGTLVSAQTGSAAAAGESVDAKNADLVAQCNLQTQTVSTTGQTVYYIGNQGYPASATGYLNNVYTQVGCQILDENNVVVSTFNRATQGPWLISTRNSGQILPPTHNYHVCTSGYVKLSNGSVSAVPTTCR